MHVRALAIAAAVCIAVAAAPAAGDPVRYDLPRVLAAAQRGPALRAAAAAAAEARAARDEARGRRLPRVEVQALAAPSPEIRCLDVACTQTAPEEASVDFRGVFGRAEIQLVQPLFTFGKLDAAARAADHAIGAARAAGDAAAGDVAVLAARAYYGVKLARETRWMLEEGRERLDGALAKVNDQLAAGSPDVTLQDRFRLEVLAAEVDTRLATAREREAVALAGLRALVADPRADVDDEPLEALAFDAGNADAAATRARAAQPEVRTAAATAALAEDAARGERARYFPDLVLIGGVAVARATSVDNPPSAFANDPYNTTSAGLGLGLRWAIDPFAQPARVRRAEARARRARWLAEVARQRADYAARAAYEALARAGERVDIARAGERSARAWLASALQSDAVGAIDAKDLADAYLAYFTARGRTLEALHAWNVAVFELQRATGAPVVGAPAGK
ncbi:MAG: TolC family protein [Deltaproteobacteria bacterium]|nr:MAG: TolC family protein [Deltaproteobacteria bacterium]